MPKEPPPTFDAERFAKWLRRWKAAENLEWAEIAERSGLHVSTLHQLARGTPQRHRAVRGQREVNPGIVTIARLAHGLGLEFGYVASKGGLFGGGADRWEHFSRLERALVDSALRNPLFNAPGGWDVERRRLLDQLTVIDPINEEIPA